MRKIAFMAAGLFLFFGVSSVWADATVETLMKSGGFQGMGAFEGTTVSRIQGLKMSESTATKFTGAILSLLPGGGERITIHRIDKGVIWELDTKKKTYTESQIEPFKPRESSGKDVEKEKPRARVTKSEFNVRKTGASETINSFPCEEYIITWLVEIEDLETKTKTENTMVTNLWTTPETSAIKKLQAEQSAFSNAYMKKLGLNLPPAEMKQFGMEAVASLSGSSQKEMDKEFGRFKNEMAKIKGYPIRTVVNWKKAGGDAPKAEKTAATESQGPAGALGDLLGGFKGAISKKLSGGESKPAGGGSFFSSTTEVKTVHAEPIPADTFEIPSTYVKN
jgi:hypothetical protein